MRHARPRTTLLGAALALALTLSGLALGQGGTLRIGISGDIDNFDPAFNQLIMYEAMIRVPVFDALTGLDVDMNVVPGLATGWTQESDTVWVFDLRQGVAFHDGSPFTAADVIATFERTTEQGLIFASKLEPIETITAVDDHTLRLELAFPVATLLEDLYQVAITPAGADADALRRQPIGTGPFRFVSWSPNERIVLERNDDYWAGPAQLDGIVLRVLPDPAAAVSNLLAGEIDAIYDVSVDATQLVEGEASVVVQSPDASGSIFLAELGINNSEPLQDVRVRRALAHTVDQDTINAITYFGFGQPLCSPLPSFSWAFLDAPCPAYDLDAARALLAEAGFGSGLTLSVDIIAGFSEMETIATIWQASLAQVGVTLDVQASEVSIWLDRYIGKEFELILNFFNSSSDPNSLFDIIYKPLLATVYTNPEMRAMIDEAVQVSDMDARRALYEQLQRDTLELAAPVIVMQSRPLLSLTRAEVEGWRVNGKNIPFLRDVSVR